MYIEEHRGSLWLPKTPEQVFPFFADAENLETITPPWLHFKIVTPNPVEMGVGALIDYHLRVHGIPIRWRTRITEWNPPHSFRDEQIRGPYRLWDHRHTFEESNGGTTAGDVVRFASPGGWLIHRLFVRRDVETIFRYRAEVLQKHFAQ